MPELPRWDIYQMTSAAQSLIGVKMRGTLRKWAIEQRVNLLTENASDEEGVVRFALLADMDVELVEDFLRQKVSDISIQKVGESVANPVLSKLKVNDDACY